MEYTAYIDESGDDGIARGSRWFVLSAAIVENQADGSRLGQMLIDLKLRIEYTKYILHWTDLSHLRKLAVAQEIGQAPIIICSVIIDTSDSDTRRLASSGSALYFFALRKLVERISWLCDDLGAKVRLRPENKGRIRRTTLESSLASFAAMPDSQIRPDTIIDIKPMAKYHLPLLQVADTIAGAICAGLEHRFGEIEPAYLMRLRDRFYRNVWKYLGARDYIRAERD